MKALDGVRILDMTHVQSGPTCTQLLAWFGADVIKVERPGKGDATRGQLRDIPDVDSLYFTMLNHNKRSITLNTKDECGKGIFTRLIESCDVLVENFAPGALDRMGFSWERIQEINPRIIYASVKGFGPGPYEDCKVYENVAQCTGGGASTTGFPSGPPVVTGGRLATREPVSIWPWGSSRPSSSGRLPEEDSESNARCRMGCSICVASNFGISNGWPTDRSRNIPSIRTEPLVLPPHVQVMHLGVDSLGGSLSARVGRLTLTPTSTSLRRPQPSTGWLG